MLAADPITLLRAEPITFRFSSWFTANRQPSAASTLKLPREKCPECGLWFRATHIRRHMTVMHSAQPEVVMLGQCQCGKSIPQWAEHCYAHEWKDDRMLELDMITRVSR